ncbi:deoxyguanosinetriphosphate triphosphohydrolase [Thermoanaerobacterium thermosaccharolyticum]|uniref:Deoxyguanosinetriphosphate triphosphohydrolase-like protein n=2 Tax=Thermoanaerobacterium thermosaccharolyticum TaxID=1517 RepID=D9TMT8_THETC|nr:deoxyguanosinetriphosphate triphosphohydrolase [Thermoanaerobacterium thermosaccharolyticum]TCW34796.1 dGTPase [Thermohydrogenium kirishiense]ADL69496.1 deoxyguanosinetriphosphate triphosphohydrolase [Thermoanaerobacterium thermosaccharolyticum DSM 571]AST56633.1 deoxyguanosinetriphosphate triphosphohydrolase [Thermoanaerobacterium thermosaccharolyticum]OXT08361.1 deoxyguanosinetriphosphate triphosphohydrolase [Thermoanaerobacterium thermosaccharolyticum]PHO06743.1 deoxyguanosinetriphosphat
MNIREISEDMEYKILSPYAAHSMETKGRVSEEEKCDIRTDFQRDRDRIIHCKAFRRLSHKTQVFISPEGDHYRTRLTHTLEVAQISKTIARALRLNEDLTEAIALGHDLGHTPFGHSGEQVLNKLLKDGFRHNVQSLRVVDVLENNGSGLNLTWEVRDGILNHSTSGSPGTLEGKIVQLSDKIAYVNHDIDDAIRGKILTNDDIPRDLRQILGDTHSKRINTMVRDIIENSMGKNDISMSDDIYEATYSLRDFLFKKVYIGSKAKSEEIKAKKVVEQLFNYFYENVDGMPKEFVELTYKYGKERAVADYIAGMTDKYAIIKYKELFLPSPWEDKNF